MTFFVATDTLDGERDGTARTTISYHFTPLHAEYTLYTAVAAKAASKLPPTAFTVAARNVSGRQDICSKKR